MRTSIVVIFITVLIAAGCSKSSPQTFNSEEGRHDTPNWLPDQHGLAVTSGSTGTADAAANATESCSECHGADLGGGISGVSCGACHLGGPTRVHPATWTDTARDHAPYVLENNNTLCSSQYCHGTNLDGVANSGSACSICHLGGPSSIHPLEWAITSSDHSSFASTTGTTRCATAVCHGTDLTGLNGSGPSCSSCHLGGPTAAHPSAWTNLFLDHGPYATANGTAVCSNRTCHGTSLAGVPESGPSCTTCHGLPFTQASLVCNACHGLPPNGTVSPNIAGAHASHASLNNSSYCSTCHLGAGGMTDNTFHLNGTPDIFFNPIYNSKTGAASYDPVTKTCSNITCHGGPRTQTQAQALTEASTPGRTPAWDVGIIDVASQCSSCHVFDRPLAAEYNSYNSGDHFLHVWDPNHRPNPKLGCEVCHDAIGLAASHFADLNTAVMEKPPFAAINAPLQYNRATGTCNPQAGGLTGCHGVNVW